MKKVQELRLDNSEAVRQLLAYLTPSLLSKEISRAQALEVIRLCEYLKIDIQAKLVSRAN
jgi:hypothetical protein